MIKSQIPNTITLLNLISGSIAIVFALEGDLVAASWMIGLAAVLDFFDGFAARMLKVSSAIGKELDSLADVISFGLAPGMILFVLLQNNINAAQVAVNGHNLLPYLAFLVPAMSAYRLAKFNLDTRQTDAFIGLPTPANAIMIASFPLIITYDGVLISKELCLSVIENVWFLVPFILIFSFLLVSEIKLFSLKFKTFGWGENKLRYTFLIMSGLLSVLLLYQAIPLIIVLYVVMSVLSHSGTRSQ